MIVCLVPNLRKPLHRSLKMMKPTMNTGSLKATKASAGACPRVIPAATRIITTRVAAPERAAPVTVAPAHPEVLKLVLDKLRYQVGTDAADASANEAYRASGEGHAAAAMGRR